MDIKDRNYRIFGRTKGRNKNKLNLELYKTLLKKFNLNKGTETDSFPWV